MSAYDHVIILAAVLAVVFLAAAWLRSAWLSANREQLADLDRVLRNHRELQRQSGGDEQLALHTILNQLTALRQEVRELRAAPAKPELKLRRKP